VRRRLLPVLVALLVAGCGEDSPPASDGGALAAEPGDFPERVAGGGMLHIVRLVHAGDQYAFAPDTVVAEPGDGIRFVHTSYQPESVAFDPGGLDPAAQAVLAEQDALSGRLLTAPGAAFDVHLEGLEPGSYRFYSRPHVQAGAEGVVRILSTD
jgi:plastocyanin